MQYFGNSRALNFGPAFLADLSRKIRVSLGVLHGVLGLPIPFPVEMYLVGEPAGSQDNKL
jgi:hypothetical protein